LSAPELTHQEVGACLFYRQSIIYGRKGDELDRDLLASWVGAAGHAERLGRNDCSTSVRSKLS
jgi:hypothetical protein